MKLVALETSQKLNERNFDLMGQKQLSLAGKDIHLEEEIARVENLVNGLSAHLAYTKKLAHYI